MVKIAHECPLSIFNEVRSLTDYDYFLVHLFDELPEYKEKYLESKEKGREIILDNSIFELETAFEPNRFAKKVQELQPDWYIVPDVLEDYKGTVKNMTDWNERYRDLPGKKIGVVQGKTYSEIMNCYAYMDMSAEVDMIAISFDYSYYQESVPHPNKYVSWALGRVKLLGDLVKDDIINIEKPHHLLGASLPLEFKLLEMACYDWIYSIDTSNPVVHAIKNTRYEENFGLKNKESQKLHTMINYPGKEINKELLYYNMIEFRKLVNG